MRACVCMCIWMDRWIHSSNDSIGHRHNDLPWQLRDRFQNHLKDVNLSLNISEYDHSVVGTMWHTDIPRLRAGRVGGQVHMYMQVHQ